MNSNFGPDDLGDMLSLAKGWCTATGLADRLRGRGFRVARHDVTRALERMASDGTVVRKHDVTGFVHPRYVETEDQDHLRGTTAQMWALASVAERLVAERDERESTRQERRARIEESGLGEEHEINYQINIVGDIQTDVVVMSWATFEKVLTRMMEID